MQRDEIIQLLTARDERSTQGWEPHPNFPTSMTQLVIQPSPEEGVRDVRLFLEKEVGIDGDQMGTIAGREASYIIIPVTGFKRMEAVLGMSVPRKTAEDMPMPSSSVGQVYKALNITPPQQEKQQPAR